MASIYHEGLLTNEQLEQHFSHYIEQLSRNHEVTEYLESNPEYFDGLRTLFKLQPRIDGELQATWMSALGTEQTLRVGSLFRPLLCSRITSRIWVFPSVWAIASVIASLEPPEGSTNLGIADGEIVDIIGDAGDGVERQVLGFRATRYDVPHGSCAGYYPECNPLLPLWHHAARSHVPAAKSIPVRIRRHTTV